MDTNHTPYALGSEDGGEDRGRSGRVRGRDTRTSARAQPKS